MNRRIVIAAFLAVALIVVACVDLSAPSGAASVSLVQGTFVVRGDSSRDSTGAVVPLSVIAFDGNQRPITGITPTFVIVDSNPVAHLLPSGVLVGDKLGSVRVFAQVGQIQTPPDTVFITVLPTRIERGAAVPDTIKLPLSATDTLPATALPVVVKGLGDTTVAKAIVHYTLVRGLPSLGATPALFIGDDSKRPMTIDTTNASDGTAKLNLIVRFRQLSADVAQQLGAGTLQDSAIVEASVKYKGKELGGSPVRFVFKFALGGL